VTRSSGPGWKKSAKLKTFLAELEKLDVDTEEFTRQLSELRDAVIDHAEHEEQDEFAKRLEPLTSPKRRQDTALRPKPQLSEPTATSEELSAGGTKPEDKN
jgi:hypothetical protein